MMMDAISLTQLKRDKLLEIAREQNIKNPSRYRKTDLVEEIMKQHQAAESYRIKRSKKIKSLKEAETRGGTTVQEAPAAEPQPAQQSYQAPQQAPLFSLPYSYNTTKVVLMVRDPYWAYAYWDIDEAKYKEVSYLLQSHSGRMKVILRGYDVTDVEFTGSNAHRVFDVDVSLDARGWYIHLGVANRDYCVDLGLLDDQGVFHLIARSNIMRSPRDTMSDVVDENWMIRDFDEIYSLSGGLGIGLSSGELRRRKRLLFEQILSSGAVASSPGFFMKQPGEKAKDFFLEVDTELILYGRTMADATVTIAGKQVPLRPDGTFSIRFHLPDGYKHLPVEATNADQDDRRKITVNVDKNTQ